MKPGQVVYEGKTKKGKSIIIRYPKASDAVAATKFINRLSKERSYLLVQGEKISLKEEKKWLKGVLDKVKKGKAVNLMAFSGERLVGGTSVDLKEKIYKHRGAFGIAIAKDFRGEGLGKLMMTLILKEAKKNLKGLRVVKLNVFGNNKPAMSLYEKMGFIEYGRMPEGIRHRGKYVDDVLMYKKV